MVGVEEDAVVMAAEKDAKRGRRQGRKRMRWLGVSRGRRASVRSEYWTEDWGFHIWGWCLVAAGHEE